MHPLRSALLAVTALAALASATPKVIIKITNDKNIASSSSSDSSSISNNPASILATKKPVCHGAAGNCPSCCNCNYNEYGYYIGFTCNCSGQRQVACNEFMGNGLCHCSAKIQIPVTADSFVHDHQDHDVFEDSDNDDVEQFLSSQIDQDDDVAQAPLRITITEEDDGEQGGEEVHAQALVKCPNWQAEGWPSKAIAEKTCSNICRCELQSKNPIQYVWHCYQGTEAQQKACYHGCATSCP